MAQFESADGDVTFSLAKSLDAGVAFADLGELAMNLRALADADDAQAGARHGHFDIGAERLRLLDVALPQGVISPVLGL